MVRRGSPSAYDIGPAHVPAGSEVGDELDTSSLGIAEELRREHEGSSFGKLMKVDRNSLLSCSLPPHEHFKPPPTPSAARTRRRRPTRPGRGSDASGRRSDGAGAD